MKEEAEKSGTEELILDHRCASGKLESLEA